MSDVAIKIENLSKQYRLGVVGTGTLSHDLKRWWTVNMRGKEDPYLKIGETNDRSTKTSSEYVWALKDINLEIKQGDVVGIIGKNGAGKSTLLKILSKVTKPTTGTIQYKGRIASLLEVGTGFHMEMTGRENIYMNGSIMGMTRAEITRKLDEIIDFAGVERFIDTPVKRYSSGMTVRLGFAIAAHLEPEILVVDEVLAVGDAEFQKKAIGKMQDVSKGEGRTVLFVSHNMIAIKQLCLSCILMHNGMVKTHEETDDAISKYLDGYSEINCSKYETTLKSKNKIHSIEVIDCDGKSKEQFEYNETIIIKIKFSCDIASSCLGIAIKNIYGIKISTEVFDSTELNNTDSVALTIPSSLLLNGKYLIDASLFIKNGYIIEYLEDALSFSIFDVDSHLAIYGNANVGLVALNGKWNY